MWNTGPLEISIPHIEGCIELDKPRTLLFDLNAFAELEDKFGSLDQAFQKMQQGSVKATRTLLWAGLLYYVGTVVLNMSETVFWKSTLRKLHAVFRCHCEHMPKPTGKKQSACP